MEHPSLLFHFLSNIKDTKHLYSIIFLANFINVAHPPPAKQLNQVNIYAVFRESMILFCSIFRVK